MGRPPEAVPRNEDPADAAASGRVETRASGPLPPADAAQVLDLVHEATEADGVGPLSEHVMLHLRYGANERARNVRLWHSGQLAGYGYLDRADPAGVLAGEMVIRPTARRRGLGRALGRALVTEAGDSQVRLWAHGELPAAARLAATTGFRRSRALWQLRRSLRDPLPSPDLPEGISVRTFRVGHDEDAWVAVNHQAFARHPEQGTWTRADLELREHEPWFDPDGFFLAERDDRLAGFHWTKVHGGHGGGESGRTGEVYVIGVDPAEQGSGLGRALTLIGLRYLRGRGLPQVMLYTDETNARAIRLYESLGFTHSGTDVMFSGGGGC